jgi:N-methylhydantoinase A
LSDLRAEADAAMPDLAALFEPLLRQADADLAAEGFARGQTVIETALDVRYAGQSYEITVPAAEHYRAEFDARHERRYGYANPQRPIEVVNLRVTATGITAKPPLPRLAFTRTPMADPRRIGEAQFGGRRLATAFYRWEDLPPGSIGDGPAVVAGGQATAVLPPRTRFRIDDFGNLIAVRAGAAVRDRVREQATVTA